MVWEDREASERIEVEAADEAYMRGLRRQNPELMEAERAIFASVEGGEVIVLSSDDGVEGSEDGGMEGVQVGAEDEEIDIDEWRSAFPNDSDAGTGSHPARGTPYLTRKD